MKRIILITGGQRSGKSRKAEELALSLSANPVYIATAHIWDEEFQERVRRHQEARTRPQKAGAQSALASFDALPGYLSSANSRTVI